MLCVSFKKTTNDQTFMTSVKLVSITPNAEDILGYCARVSNPANQGKPVDKLLKYCLEHKHFSVFEMANAIIEVNTTRDIARQILRHRSFSFQEFCITGDSLVTTYTECGRTKKIPIKDLYKRYTGKYWGRSDNYVKIFDGSTKTFTKAKIKEVFNTGVKPVYEVVLENGRKIKSTLDHKFYTKEGFKRLGDLAPGMPIGCNGEELYQNKEWLQARKAESISNGLGLPYIAEVGSVSYHTIRKWLKRHGLQYTKKEVSSFTEIWNKDLPAEQQPRYGKFQTAETRDKIRASHKKGEASSLYSTGNTDWRKSITVWCKGYHTELLHKQGFRCPVSGENITRSTSEVDHILPIYSHPELAKDPTNLQVLSTSAHHIKSMEEASLSRKTMKFSLIKSISYVGEEQTYDLEVEHTDHNYVANGIVTHNSQRYADPVSLGSNFVMSEARLQDHTNRQNSIEVEDESLQNWWDYQTWNVQSTAWAAYQEALAKGVAKEVARKVLPEGLTMSRMYINGTIRSWIHYCEVRRDAATQKEHREVADAIYNILKEQLPNVFTE